MIATLVRNSCIHSFIHSKTWTEPCSRCRWPGGDQGRGVSALKERVHRQTHQQVMGQRVPSDRGREETDTGSWSRVMEGPRGPLFRRARKCL